MQKPTLGELGADILNELNNIGDLNTLPEDIKRATIVAVITALKALIPTKTSQITNDSSFTTGALARADKTQPFYFEKRTTDPAFDSTQAARAWYRSDLDV